MKLSIIVVNYNSWEDTFQIVDRVLASNAAREGMCEIIVVDNCSSKNPPLPLKEKPGLQWLLRQENGGFSAGVNTGAKVARGEWLLLLNPDVVLDLETIGKCIALLSNYDSINDNNQNVGVIGCQLNNPDGSVQPSVGLFPKTSRIIKELFLPKNRRRYATIDANKKSRCEWVTGAFMLIRKNAFTSVGGFSEDFFLYFEETDFCLRLSDAGWVCMYDPSLSVCHGNPLQNRETPAHIRVYTRHSRMLYFKRNRPAYESFLMNIALFLEAIIRITINRFSGDWNQVLAWNLIMQLAVGFIRGSYPKGTSVRRLVSDSLHVG